jgi:hypothetical protein
MYCRGLKNRDVLFLVFFCITTFSELANGWERKYKKEQKHEMLQMKREADFPSLIFDNRHSAREWVDDIVLML